MRQVAALKLVPVPVPHPLDGKPVLESAALRRGHKRSTLSRFEDGTWDLSPAVFRENARICPLTSWMRASASSNKAAGSELPGFTSGGCARRSRRIKAG